MAILDSLKKNTDDAKDASSKKAKAKVSKEKKVSADKKGKTKKDTRVDLGLASHSLYSVIKKPYITEKAAILSDQNAYTFDVDPATTKPEIAKAIKVFYGVTPRRINIIRLPGKVKRFKGRLGKTSQIKKAVVYLDKKDKIEFV